MLTVKINLDQYSAEEALLGLLCLFVFDPVLLESQKLDA